MGLNCTEQELVDIHSDAIKDHAPAHHRKDWFSGASSKAGIGEDAFKKYFYALNAPSLWNFLALLKHLGKTYGDPIVETAGFHLHPLGEDDPSVPDDAEFNLAMAEKLEAAAGDFRQRAAGVRKGGAK